jgi:hypothetical protein
VLKMRIIGRLPDKRQVGFLVDSLKNSGFDRKDMIVSDLMDAAGQQAVPEEVADKVAFIKTERDGAWETGAFSDGVKSLEGGTGIIVAVKTPKHDADRVRAIMEQSGAIEIIQD